MKSLFLFTFLFIVGAYSLSASASYPKAIGKALVSIDRVHDYLTSSKYVEESLYSKLTFLEASTVYITERLHKIEIFYSQVRKYEIAQESMDLSNQVLEISQEYLNEVRDLYDKSMYTHEPKYKEGTDELDNKIKPLLSEASLKLTNLLSASRNQTFPEMARQYEILLETTTNLSDSYSN